MISRASSLFATGYNITKAGISISVALSTATGYFLSTGKVDLSVIYPFFGVLLMAMSASMLNQIQERNTDKLMHRTLKRPLVNGSVSVQNAVIISVILAITGFLILFFGSGRLPAVLGLFNLLWYNLVYTPLKYKTAFASVPGGIVGALPPIIGWVAGGGHILHPASMALALFFFIGQIPHFWLILFKYADEYKLAGIKLVTDKFNKEQLKRVIFSWTLATALSGSLLAFFTIIHHNFVFYFIHFVSLGLIAYFVFWLPKKPDHESYKAFIVINVYYLLVMIILITDVALK